MSEILDQLLRQAEGGGGSAFGSSQDKWGLLQSLGSGGLIGKTTGPGGGMGSHDQHNKQKGGGSSSHRLSSRLSKLPDRANNSKTENIRLARALIAKRFPKFDNRQDIAALRKLWTRESGWSAHADNPTSSAYGIPQMMLSVHNVPNGYMNTPSIQEMTGLKYIRGRYGDPSGAWRHSQATGWY